MEKFEIMRKIMKLTNNLGRLLLIKFFGTFGSEMLSFAISLYVLQKTGSALSMGISLITGPLINVVMAPLVGYVVDTFNHRTVMILAQISTIVALTMFSILFRIFPEFYFIELVILIGALSITDSFLSTAVQASLSRLFARDNLEKANSLNQSVSSFAEFLAPVLGAVVYTLVSLDVFAYIEIGFEGVALLAISTLVFTPVNSSDEETDPSEATLGRESVFANFIGGLRFLWEHKIYLLLSGSSGIINFFFATVNLGLPFLLVDRLHLSNSQYGFTQSAFAGGMILGGLILSRLHLKIPPLNFAYLSLSIFGVIIAIIGLPGIARMPGVWYCVIFSFLNVCLGILLVFSNTPVDVYMQQTIPENVQGRVFTLDEALSTVLMPLGTLVFGLFFDRMNATVVFLIGGIPMLLLSVVVLIVIGKRVESQRGTQESLG